MSTTKAVLQGTDTVARENFRPKLTVGTATPTDRGNAIHAVQRQKAMHQRLAELWRLHGRRFVRELAPTP